MAAGAAPGGAGGAAARDGSYWVCHHRRCGQWNYCTRQACLACQTSAPPWAVRRTAAQPVVDAEGWVRPGRGKKGRRKARGAAAAATDAAGEAADSGGDGSSRQGRAASSRLAVLQEAIAHAEAAPRLGGESEQLQDQQLELLRAQRDEEAAAAAEGKEAGLTRAAKLRREAASASRNERQVAKARRALQEADQAKEEAEAAIEAAHAKLELAEEQRQTAQERLDNLEAVAAEARESQESRPVSIDDLQAVRGLFVQLRTLPTAHTAGNFTDAWQVTMEQLAAIEALLPPPQEEPVQTPRQRWGDRRPPIDGDGLDSDSDVELVEQPAEERGQAERRGPAKGGWPKVQSAAGRALAEAGRLEAADLGPLAAAAAAPATAAASRRPL